jgi:hypothetical protein
MLVRLTDNDATRVWLLVGAAVLILVGLLPASRPILTRPLGS